MRGRLKPTPRPEVWCGSVTHTTPLAIRGKATCELRIPREKCDGVLFLDLLERHGATLH